MIGVLRNMTQVIAKHVGDSAKMCQEPSGLRPEGHCHFILFKLGVRLHAEWQNVGSLERQNVGSLEWQNHIRFAPRPEGLLDRTP